MKRRIKRLLIIIVAIALIIFVATSILNYVSGRKLEHALNKIKQAGEPITLAEMAPPEIPDSENAAIPLEVAALLMKQNRTNDDLNDKQFYRIVKDYCDDPLDTEKKEQAVAALSQLIEKNQDVLEYLNRAAALGKCRFNIDYTSDNPFSILLPHLSPLRISAKLLSAEALLLAATDRPDQALAAVEKAFILANYLKDDPILIDTLVQIAIHEIATKRLEEILQLASSSPERCRELIKEVIRSRRAINITNAFMSERVLPIKTFESIRSGKIPLRKLRALVDVKGNILWSLEKILPDFLLNYNELYCLDMMNKMVRASRMPYSKELGNAMENEVTNTSGIFFIAKSILPSVYKVKLVETRNKARLGAAEIGLRLIIYRAEKGKLPDTLDELGVEIPLDPFTGKGFIYRQRDGGFIVYSVGENEVDDGGKLDKGRSKKFIDVGFRYRYPAENTVQE